MRVGPLVGCGMAIALGLAEAPPKALAQAYNPDAPAPCGYTPPAGAGSLIGAVMGLANAGRVADCNRQLEEQQRLRAAWEQAQQEARRRAAQQALISKQQAQEAQRREQEARREVAVKGKQVDAAQPSDCESLGRLELTFQNTLDTIASQSLRYPDGHHGGLFWNKPRLGSPKQLRDSIAAIEKSPSNPLADGLNAHAAIPPDADQVAYFSARDANRSLVLYGRAGCATTVVVLTRMVPSATPQLATCWQGDSFGALTGLLAGFGGALGFPDKPLTLESIKLRNRRQPHPRQQGGELGAAPLDPQPHATAGSGTEDRVRTGC